MKIQTIASSMFCSLQGSNVCRPEGDYDDPKDRVILAQSLATRGIDPALGYICVHPMTAEEVERATVERKFQWAVLKASQESLTFQLVQTDGTKTKTVVNAGMILKAFEDLYVSKGEVIPPEFKVLSGHRRNGTFPYAHALACAIGVPGLKRCPVAVYEGLTLDEQASLNLKENLLKLEGSKQVSILGQFASARVLVGAGYKESNLEVSCGVARGTAQKMYALLYLDAQFPEAKLADGIMSGEFAYSKFDKEETRTLAKKQKDEGCVTAAEVVEFIQGQLDADKKKNKPKMISRPKMDGISSTCPVTILRQFALACMQGDVGVDAFLLKMNPKFEAINNATKEFTA